MCSKRLLILGGTTLARELTDQAAKCSSLHVSVCLTKDAIGYDNADDQIVGLISDEHALKKLVEQTNIDYLIDATHPFAPIISGYAVKASTQTKVPLLTLQNMPWYPQMADQWIEVDSHQAAIDFISKLPTESHIFLTVGGRNIPRYAALKEIQFTARCIRANLDAQQKNVVLIKEKGPFELQNERALFKSQQFDYLVTKNSGGKATYNKIIAAAQFGVRVIMIRRLTYDTGKLFTDVSSMMKFLLDSNQN